MARAPASEAKPAPPVPAPPAADPGPGGPLVADAPEAAPVFAEPPAEFQPETEPAIEPEPQQEVLSAPARAGGEPTQSLEAAVHGFLNAWARAVEDQDYGLYRRLGFSGSKGRFTRSFKGHRDRFVSFEEVSQQRAADGRIRVKAMMVYSYTGRTGSRVQKKTRRLVLEETDEGLRYVEPWN
jgi:hypothetical protein